MRCTASIHFTLVRTLEHILAAPPSLLPPVVRSFVYFYYIFVTLPSVDLHSFISCAIVDFCHAIINL